MLQKHKKKKKSKNQKNQINWSRKLFWMNRPQWQKVWSVKFIQNTFLIRSRVTVGVVALRLRWKLDFGGPEFDPTSHLFFRFFLLSCCLMIRLKMERLARAWACVLSYGLMTRLWHSFKKKYHLCLFAIS